MKGTIFIAALVAVVCLLSVFLAIITHYQGDYEETKCGLAPYGSVSSGFVGPADDGSVLCGDTALHRLMVNYISEREPHYLYCLKYRGRNDCYFNNEVFISFVRRVLALRVEQHKPLRTIQFGALDGWSNDPLYASIIAPHSPKMKRKSVNSSFVPSSLANWHAILVEPIFMHTLQESYSKIASWSDVNLNNIHLSEHAIVPEKSVGTDGKCMFYEVDQKELCPYKQKTWLRQAGGTSNQPLQIALGTDFEHCVTTIEVPCLSIATLMINSGVALVLDPETNTHCVPTGTGTGTQSADAARVDILVVDVEGSDGAIISAYLNELCPLLWPSVILYEDKVMRHNDLHNTNATRFPDDVVVSLEKAGYYVHLIGEDVIAYRVGYNINDLRHVPFPDDYKSVPWLHPFSTRSRVPQYYIPNPLQKDIPGIRP